MENILGDVLSQLRGQRTVGFETVSDQVARGLDQSALVDIVKAQGGNIEAGLAGLAAALGAAVTEICREIRESNHFLSELTNATLHPLETEAREQYRRGLHALERGWSEESVIFFQRAVEKSPVSAEIWFSLGLAHVACDENSDAIASLNRATKYGTDDAPGVAAGAFMTLAGLAPDEQAAMDTLMQAATALPHCAEIHFALARHTGDVNSLTDALQIAPELATPAVAAIPALAEQVPAILRAPNGPVTKASVLRSKVTLFGDTFTPAVPAKWVYSEGQSLDADALSAAETFTYVRTHLSDLWSLARYGLAPEQRPKIRERAALANDIAATAGRLKRVRPWQPLDPDPSELRPSSQTAIRILTSPTGLVVPGDHSTPFSPEQFFVDISGDLLARLERGDLPGATVELRRSHPELDEHGAENILSIAVTRLWG